MSLRAKTIIFVIVVGLLVYAFFAFDVPYPPVPADTGSLATSTVATSTSISSHQ